MTAPIGPGDFVECVKDVTLYGKLVAFKGRSYCVEGVKHIPGNCGDPEGASPCPPFGVLLVGVDRPRGAWLCGCAVRPIYRRDESLIQRLRQPVEELAEA